MFKSIVQINVGDQIVVLALSKSDNDATLNIYPNLALALQGITQPLNPVCVSNSSRYDSKGNNAVMFWYEHSENSGYDLLLTHYVKNPHAMIELREFNLANNSRIKAIREIRKVSLSVTLEDAEKFYDAFLGES